MTLNMPKDCLITPICGVLMSVILVEHKINFRTILKLVSNRWKIENFKKIINAS